MIAENVIARYPPYVSSVDRRSALQAILRKKAIPAMLVTDPLNIRYLTGFVATEALLLVQTRRSTLIVDGRYAEAAAALRSNDVRVADRANLVALLAKIPRCAFEEDHVTVARLQRWKALFKNTKFIRLSGLVEGLRRKKDSSEITCMRRARSLTNTVLARVPSYLVPGVTEKHVANRILTAMLELGADGLAFEAIVAFGKNSSLPHHRAGRAVLRRRDIVQIDIGAKWRGYCADRSEVFFVGEPTDRQRSAYEAVHSALRASMRAAKAGIACADLDARARKHLSAFPPFPHALGHGVGLDVHEGIVLAARSKDFLLDKEVIAIEPGVYFEGEFGIRLEDTVVVNDS
jgi:Xaa-Pro aminopeptidase